MSYSKTGPAAVRSLPPQVLRQADEADRLMAAEIKELGERRSDASFRERARELGIPYQVLQQADEADRLTAAEIKMPRLRLCRRRSKRGEGPNRLDLGVSDARLTTDMDESDIRKLEKGFEKNGIAKADIEKRVKKEKEKKEREEQKIKTLVETILPGAWTEFKTVCAMASGMKNLADRNKTAPIRRNERAIRDLAHKLRDELQKAAPATLMALPPNSQEWVSEILDDATVLVKRAGDLPDGKQPLEHRNYLAGEIVKLMRQRGIEPGTGGGRKGVSPFKRLVQQGLYMVEGPQSRDLRPILEAALNEAKV